MKYSTKDYLKAVASLLCPHLGSRDALYNVCKLAQNLPLFPDGVLECRLGTNVSRVDLSVVLPRTGIGLPETLLAHPLWQQCQILCRDAAEPNSAWSQSISEIWLEFDVEGSLEGIPIPCILLGFNQKAAKDVKSLLETALKLLDLPLSCSRKAHLQLCLDALPANAKVLGFGAMLSRQTDALRINVQEIYPSQVPAYLAENGWIGAIEQVEELLSTLNAFFDNIILSFDFADIICPRIGLECYLEKSPIHEPRWELFLEQLVERGLCTSAQHNALLAWPGDSECELGILTRFITHFKVVYQAGIPLEVKAYLGVCHNLEQL